MLPAIQLTALIALITAAAAAVGDSLGHPALVIGSCIFAAAAIGVVGYLVTAGD